MAKKKKDTVKKRPPRVYFDKVRKRYYIKVNKKKLYFPDGLTAGEAIRKSIKKIRVDQPIKIVKTPPKNWKNLSINSEEQPVYREKFRRKQNKDTPLIITHDPKEAQRILAEERRNADIANATKYIKQNQEEETKRMEREAEKTKLAEAQAKADTEKKGLQENAATLQRENNELYSDIINQPLPPVDNSLRNVRYFADQPQPVDISSLIPPKDPNVGVADAEPFQRLEPAADAPNLPGFEYKDMEEQKPPEDAQAAEGAPAAEDAQAPEDLNAPAQEPAKPQDKPRRDYYTRGRNIGNITNPKDRLIITSKLKTWETTKNLNLVRAAAGVSEDSDLSREQLIKLAIKRNFSHMVGKGKRFDDVQENGLYSDQIADLMEPYAKDGFIGVVSADDIKQLIPASLEFDKFGFIMNKDKKNQPGSHWVAIYCDLTDEKEINYFDSFAEEPDPIFYEQIKKLIDAHKLPIYLKMKINKIVEQSNSSALCGFHAMKFLIDRFKGKEFKDVSGYSDIRHGEDKAKELLHKYDRFGYI